MNPEQREVTEASPDAFTEWLSSMHADYLQLSVLAEKEKDYAKKIADVLAMLQREADGLIPLDRRAFEGTAINVHSASLVPDAMLLLVDSAGNKSSMPLKELPPQTVLRIVRESILQIRRLMIEKRRILARRIHALERVAAELENIQEIPRELDDHPTHVVEESPSDEAGVPESDKVATVLDQVIEVQSSDFSFKGTYEEHRQALDGHQYPFTTSGGPSKTKKTPAG